MDKYITMSFKRFAENLSLKTATPGGGSASAAASALGISLLIMAARFTVNKTHSKKKNEKIKKIVSALVKAQRRMLLLVDRDAEVYESVRQALKLPKGGRDEITFRNKKIQSELKKALSVPVRAYEISSGVIPIAELLIKTGNKNLISDSYCGVSLLRAGIETAKFNIDANTKYISDSKFRTSFSVKYDRLIGASLAKIKKISEKYESKNN